MKELMLIKPANQKSAIFVTTGIFQAMDLRFNRMSAMDAVIYAVSMNLGDIAILNINGTDYGCIISQISKHETRNLISMYLRVLFDSFTVRFTLTFDECLFDCL